MKICMVGVGYVGLVVGACLSEMGHDVVCVDNQETKITALQNGQVPIYEPGIEELLHRNIHAGRLQFTTQLQEALVSSLLIFIAVGTPPAQDGSADLTYVLQVAESIGQAMEDYTIVITKSTVPIGSGEKIRAVIQKQLLHRGRPELAFDIVSNPEFLREGSAIDDFLHPDRIIVGTSDARAVPYMEELYEPLTSQGYPLLLMDIVSAELAKYASNAMLAARISFMNEMARLCEATGADIEAVKQGMGRDRRIGPHFLSAGVGYGGSCFPKDVRALIRTASDHRMLVSMLQAVDRVNREQKTLLLQKLIGHFGKTLTRRTFAIWGLAFKPGTDDIREAPAIETIRALRSKHARIQAHDPVAIDNAKRALQDPLIQYCEDPYEALEGADALLIFTEWNEYRTPDLERMRKLMNGGVIFDGRNLYSPERMREAGFVYYGIGRR
ncbi:UDP-glucose dehydrogenase family protein [Paenibacillus cremeus]|uniref:UDP-glucose 6-dehydrogenase n=1 Tax=Paenibacillus cremeus TaxID=2163881 RepID=A0A559KI80_9BACL|nr:UDP-glucose/GDP-mannose dehydrogenase family protein [Paenibacillus cremeus]TVY11826.1 UDP-glucose/GDP-mannose dehydrogenase family protein [Paenibacillus cremeus]